MFVFKWYQINLVVTHTQTLFWFTNEMMDKCTDLKHLKKKIISFELNKTNGITNNKLLIDSTFVVVVLRFYYDEWLALIIFGHSVNI